MNNLDEVQDAGDVTVSSSSFGTLSANTGITLTVDRDTTTVGEDTEIEFTVTDFSTLEANGILRLYIPTD